MKKISIAVLTVFCIGLIAVSCKKYEEGPALSFRSKNARLVNKWEVNTAIKDGIDVTVKWGNWYMDLQDDGRFVITDVVMDSTYEWEGFWELVNGNEELRLVYTIPAVDPDREYYKIKKLNNNALWMSYTDEDSIFWDFRLVTDSTGN